MDDLVQWLHDRLDEEAQRATAAGGVDWLRAEHPGENVVIFDSKGEPVVYDEGWPSEAQAAHIAEHDPARVLREIEAKRKMIADLLAERHQDSEEDTWYACAALTDEDGDPVCPNDARAPGPCDCGRDERVGRYLRLLALPYADRPGYREWRPRSSRA